MNNQYSEHIGCCIFKSCGFDTQETFLGTYTDPAGKEKIVVACKDFTQDGSVLYEFSKLGNTVVTIDYKFKASIESVYTIIEENPLIKDKERVKNNFWDMFVVDALLGNYDRHFDNWGLLERNGKVQFAPIYDCGSALASLHSDIKLNEILKNPVCFKNAEYNAKSCYTLADKRIFYHEIFKNLTEELKAAIIRIVPKIDMEKIHSIVSDTEMSDIRIEYLRKALDIRYESIIMPAFKKLQQ